jgi:hypothetical protein
MSAREQRRHRGCSHTKSHFEPALRDRRLLAELGVTERSQRINQSSVVCAAKDR